MDSIDRSEQLFQQVDAEISRFLQTIGDCSNELESVRAHHSTMLQRAQKILEVAEKIGGKLLDEAKTLQNKTSLFLEQPSEEMRQKILQSALHIKQEVREL